MKDKGELNRLINVEHLSYEEIGKRYGVSGAAIKKSAKKMGISLPVRRVVNSYETFNKGKNLKKEKRYCEQCGKELGLRQYGKFCSVKCFQDNRMERLVCDWKLNPDKYKKENLPSFIRRYLFAKYENKCSNPNCGWCEINQYTGEIPLEVHHIDGDCTNNKEENLVLLCPNCHSLTPNNGSLNNGNSKRYKLKAYKKKIKEIPEEDTVELACL